MQQIFLFFIMLIAASEAFLNGSHISTSNKKKISGFVPNARILKSVKFGNMDFPMKIDTGRGIISPRDGLTFPSLWARHKRFLNNDRTGSKKSDIVRFLRNRQFLNKRRNSARRLRLMRRKRTLSSSLPNSKTMNVNSHSGSENSSVLSVISLSDSPVYSNRFSGKALYPKRRSKAVKKRQIKDFLYLPFNFKQLLKYSKLGIKRHGRMESRNAKKHKRDAETVNVSQTNVTKDAKEKDLDEESNDSLEDSYYQDLRPDIASPRFDDTPSDWQEYLKPGRQPVSQYLLPSMSDDSDYYDSDLDIPLSSVWIPRINFRMPYDRKMYEDTDFEDDENGADFVQKIETDDIIEKKRDKKKDDKKFESSYVDKLKHLLDDVETALKEEKSCSKMKKKKGGKCCKRPGNVEDSIKAKIDVVIPLLSQISQELGKKSAQLQKIAEGKFNASEGREGKEPKGNKKNYPECSVDGVWYSNFMGLEINVSTQHNLMLKVTLKSFKKDALIDDQWCMHGLTLSKTEGPFILAAICPGKGKIASFMGQCWMCEKDEYVYGTWTIFTKEQKITNLLTAVDTKLDVLTRKKDEYDLKSTCDLDNLR